MPDPRDKVEIDGLELPAGMAAQRPGVRPTLAPAAGKPWLALLFRCSRGNGGGYVRAYRNAEGTAYTARCPGCGRPVRFGVGQGGTEERFFEVQCG